LFNKTTGTHQRQKMNRNRIIIFGMLFIAGGLYAFTCYVSQPARSRFETRKIDFSPPNENARRSALGDLEQVQNELRRWFTNGTHYQPISQPSTGDWLATHKESGQTVHQYLVSSPNRPDTLRNVIYLLPLSEFNKESTPELAQLAACVESFYGLKTKVLKMLPMQSTGVTTRIHPKTQQRQALTTDILQLLRTRLPKDGYCLLGVTMIDLYPNPDWNFVFGQASLKERVGVYSFARYKPELSDVADLAAAQNLMLRRSVTTLLHETAHMFGMLHCIYYECVVNGSNHIKESDSRPLHFCPVCLRKLYSAFPENPVVRYQRIFKTYKDIGLTEEAKWFTNRLGLMQR